ncbi:DNA mismatch repair protein MutL [Gimesia chilikensis]|uniref:DNA mismatch repair protein MutL n=1 Tax=Gimesia chilikensis TaxID=2605989 RepID=A0A517W7S2_9PLAN|nr:DNA mismatch repair endonuclease MutL [Gimesia chilikensis]QDU01299.1 DNA mismatch repair protein MutL [Gimesia chilikensis]
MERTAAVQSLSRIHQLDTSVINKIAAGEVIERPASAVKELLDNSIDALATRIEVDIMNGGADLIRVVDNGEGIHPDDLLLAVSSHATSKISNADDLFSVQTMGFRGEALASISEVSRFRIRTRTADQKQGLEFEVNTGTPGKPQPCGCPLGTSIEVRQLFANTPVRRKFLKTTKTEFGHISEQFTRAALAHPRLYMVLRHNNKVIFDLPPSDNLIDRLRLFYGKKLSDHLIWVESQLEDVRIWGYVSHPSENKSTRKGQYLFLNGRWIQDRTLQHALTEAYRGLLMVGRQPISFLYLDMPPSMVDVNVHPTKSEVRFRDSQSLYRQLLSTLRSQFLSMDLQSQMSLSKKGDLPEPSQPAVPTPEQKQTQLELTTWAKEQLKQVADDLPAQKISGEARMISPPSDLAAPFTAADAIPLSHFQQQREQEQAGAGENASPTPAEPAAPFIPDIDRPADQFAEAATADLRPIQVLNCYIVVEVKGALTIIDQHALHERIMYEYFRKRVLSQSVEAQKLLVPLTIEMSAKETALVLDHAEMLASFGLGIEEFGGNTLLVTSYPVMLKKANLEQLVRDIADNLDNAKQPSRRDLLDELITMMSCKAAIKAGQRLTQEEIYSLLEQRHLIDDAHHCPHGRPSALVLSHAELDRQFGRMG